MLASKPCFLLYFPSDTRLIFIVKVTLKIWNKSALKIRFLYFLQRTIVPRYDSIVARFFQCSHQDLLSTHRGTLLPIVARCSPSWHVASDRGTLLLISEPDFKLTLTKNIHTRRLFYGILVELRK